MTAENDSRPNPEQVASFQSDFELVRDEIAHARRLFKTHDWPVIDVTRRSIEETAAAILQLYDERMGVEP